MLTICYNWNIACFLVKCGNVN